MALIVPYFIVGILACVAGRYWGMFILALNSPNEFAFAYFFPCIFAFIVTGILVIIGIILQKFMVKLWKPKGISGFKIANLAGIALYLYSVGYPLLLLGGWRPQVRMNKVVFDGEGYVAVDAEQSQVIALKEDGSIVEWHDGYWDTPIGNGYTAVAASFNYCLAITKAGRIIAWGSDSGAVPESIYSVPQGNDFTDIVAGASYCLALKEDGSIVAWGSKKNTIVQNVPEGNDFIAIAGGYFYALALKKDGSVHKWGSSSHNSAEVVDEIIGDNCKTIDIGIAAAGLKNDGSVSVWFYSDDDNFILDAPKGNDFIDVSAGSAHGLALKKDGSIVAWGGNDSGQTFVPKGNDFKLVKAKRDYSFAIDNKGRIIGWGSWDLKELVK